MDQVQVYKLPDGTICENASEALKCQKLLDINKMLEEERLYIDFEESAKQIFKDNFDLIQQIFSNTLEDYLPEELDPDL